MFPNVVQDLIQRTVTKSCSLLPLCTPHQAKPNIMQRADDMFCPFCGLNQQATLIPTRLIHVDEKGRKFMYINWMLKKQREKQSLCLKIQAAL